MTMTRWIGPDATLAVGDTGFLIEHSNENTNSSRFELRDTPPYTNQSHQPRLTGWCGTWNNVGTYGHGMARVERVAKNGRALVVALAGDDLTVALDDLGYPELDPAQTLEYAP